MLSSLDVLLGVDVDGAGARAGSSGSRAGRASRSGGIADRPRRLRSTGHRPRRRLTPPARSLRRSSAGGARAPRRRGRPRGDSTAAATTGSQTRARMTPRSTAASNRLGYQWAQSGKISSTRSRRVMGRSLNRPACEFRNRVQRTVNCVQSAAASAGCRRALIRQVAHGLLQRGLQRIVGRHVDHALL